MSMNRLGSLALALTLAAGAGSSLHAQTPSQPPAAEAPAAAQAWKVDGTHSHVTFSISHFGISKQEGRFGTVSGMINFDPENLPGSKIAIVVDVDSIDTNNDSRDKHLKSPDFFNAEINKTAEFTSTKIEKAPGDKMYKVTGNMKFMGMTKPMATTFTWNGVGKDPRGGERTGAEASFTVSRPEWGVGEPGGAIGDEAKVSVSIEATKA